MGINAESAMDEEVSNDFSAGAAFAKCGKREVRTGFSTEISMPGRRSTAVFSIILLQRDVYRSELGVELRADARNCSDDRKRDTGGDQRSRSHRIRRAGTLERFPFASIARST